MIQDIETEVHQSLDTPALDPLNAQQWAADKNARAGDPAPNPLRVLVVDDAPSTRRFLRAVLEHCADFDVVGEAADGDTAIEQAAALQPDLVLLDLSMPTLDGASALKSILAASPETMVIVVSGMNPTVSGMMLDAGATAFVSKGMAPFDLLDRLGSILGRPITLRRPGLKSTIGTSLHEVDALQAPHKANRRAVVFETDPTVRHLITEALRLCAVEVVAETSTQSTVLAVVDLARPELVVLDLLVQDTPDLTTLSEICRRSPHSVVVVYSALEEWKDNAIAAGAAAFVRKPSIDELTDRIRQLAPSS